MNEPILAVSAFAATLVLALGLMPLAVTLGRRTGMVVRPRLFGQSFDSISYLGGAGVALSVCGALLFGATLYGFHSAIWAALLGSGMLLAFGIADDRIAPDMPPIGRLGVVALTACMVWTAGLHPTPTDIPWADALLTVFFLTAATNAFNLLDNMDGIASSTAGATLGGIAVIAAMSSQHEISLLAAALSGASFGFVPHNLLRHQVYLGNGGALFLGFLVGCLTLLLDFPLEQPWGFASAIAILAIPAVDTTLVLISRAASGRSVLKGGIDHLSHRLAYLGMTTKQAAFVHAIGSLIGGGSVVLSIMEDVPWLIGAVLVLFGAAMLVMLRIDVYTSAIDRDELGRTLPERYRALSRRRADRQQSQRRGRSRSVGGVRD
jgi:UDP-GlcNAc:undecaprenyl-phosphate GlcNAc-1-phosphate transferase